MPGSKSIGNHNWFEGGTSPSAVRSKLMAFDDRRPCPAQNCARTLRSGQLKSAKPSNLENFLVNSVGKLSFYH